MKTDICSEGLQSCALQSNCLMIKQTIAYDFESIEFIFIDGTGNISVSPKDLLMMVTLAFYFVRT